MCGIFMEHLGNFVTAIIYVELTTSSATRLFWNVNPSVAYMIKY